MWLYKLHADQCNPCNATCANMHHVRMLTENYSIKHNVPEPHKEFNLIEIQQTCFGSIKPAIEVSYYSDNGKCKVAI